MEHSPLCLHLIHTYVTLHLVTSSPYSHKVTMTYDIWQNFQMNAGIFVWTLLCINQHLIVSHIRICSCFSCTPFPLNSSLVLSCLRTNLTHPVVHFSLETLLWILPCTSLSSPTCILQCCLPFCNRFPSPHNTHTHTHTQLKTIKLIPFFSEG